MKNRVTDHLEKAKELQAKLRRDAEAGSFAHSLSASSFQSHIDELAQLQTINDLASSHEIIDFRFIAPIVESGTVPLRVASEAIDNIRKMISYAALRLSLGGIGRKRISEEIESALDLRLAGIFPGSSRLVVSAAAERDLFDDGISKNALERIFSVLFSEGKGESFLESVTELGPSSARRLREFLDLLRQYGMAAEFHWKYAGNTMKHWNGSRDIIDSISSALAVTEVTQKEEVTLSGTIELLSKREKIDLRITTIDKVRILYPRSMLPEVSKLHLDQKVTLKCEVTETDNPMTGESSIFYELKNIMNT